MFSTVTVTLALVAIATAWALRKLARMSVPLDAEDPRGR
jgi:hypothetical protein